MAQIKCRECGKNIKDDLKECPYCGAKQTVKKAKTPTRKALICKNCGEKLDEKFKICPYCGTKVEKEEPKVDTPPKRRGRPPKKKTITCEKCGLEIDATSTECPNCGYISTTKTNVETKKEVILCEECKKMIPKESTTCPECGCHILPPEEPVVSPEIIEAPKRGRGRPPKKKTIPCTECGYEMEIGLESCPECGYLVNNSKTIENTNEVINKPVQKIQEESVTKTTSESIPEYTDEEPIIVEKTKKKRIKIREVFFYLFIIIFFFAGCASAVFLYDKYKNMQKNDTAKETYRINRTLSCINENNTEEHNFYFNNNKLVQYSLYSNKTFSSNDEVEKETQSFRTKWENNGYTSVLRFNKKGVTLETVLVTSLITENTITLDYTITSKDSYDIVKETMEKEKWTCKENNKDLGTNIPLNNLKSAKLKLEDYLEKNGYTVSFNNATNSNEYTKTDHNKTTKIDTTNGVYTYTDTSNNKVLTITYNYKDSQEILVLQENGNTYQITLDTTKNDWTCTDNNWCSKNAEKYVNSNMKDVKKDFNNLIKKANITLTEITRD